MRTVLWLSLTLWSTCTAETPHKSLNTPKSLANLPQTPLHDLQDAQTAPFSTTTPPVPPARPLPLLDRIGRFLSRQDTQDAIRSGLTRLQYGLLVYVGLTVAQAWAQVMAEESTPAGALSKRQVRRMLRGKAFPKYQPLVEQLRRYHHEKEVEMLLGDLSTEELNMVMDCLVTTNPSTTSSLDTTETTLLFGPPGCGKTRALQGIDRLRLSVTPATLLRPHVGMTSRRVRMLWLVLSQLDAVLILDNIDGLLSAGTTDVQRQLLTEFLDAWVPSVTVMAATNRPWQLDPSILSRMSRQVFCGLPNAQERLAWFRHQISMGRPACPGINLDWLAAHTQAYSYTDLQAVYNAAYQRTGANPLCTDHFALRQNTPLKVDYMQQMQAFRQGMTTTTTTQSSSLASTPRQPSRYDDPHYVDAGTLEIQADNTIRHVQGSYIESDDDGEGEDGSDFDDEYDL